MEISINTPALLFPAISLLLLAYTNRFLAIANLIRKLHDDYVVGSPHKESALLQIRGLRRRLNYIRYMQGFGVFSFLLCVFSMYCIYNQWMSWANVLFALSLISLLVSLIFSLVEIIISTNALELALKDMAELDDPSFLRSGGKQEKNLKKNKKITTRNL